MKNGVSTVVFDLGGVLIDWNPRYLYKKLIRDDPERIEWFLETICTPEWNAMQDAGRTMHEATEQLVRDHPDHAELIRAYYGRWEEMLAGPIEGTVQILHEIRQRPYGLYALTNWSAETFPVARERYDFLSWFDGIVVSGEIGLIKPAAEIYHHLVEQFGIEPSESVFIDDSEPNVHAAEELGFHAIRFTDPDNLRDELRKVGIDIDSDARESG